MHLLPPSDPDGGGRHAGSRGNSQFTLEEEVVPLLPLDVDLDRGVEIQWPQKKPFH